MNTSTCKLLSNELLDKVRKEAENIGVSKFCKEIGITELHIITSTKKGYILNEQSINSRDISSHKSK